MLSRNSLETKVENSDPSEFTVNYTLTPPLRKTLKASVEKQGFNDHQKISATFTISSSPKYKAKPIHFLADQLDKSSMNYPDQQMNSITSTNNELLVKNSDSFSIDCSNKLKQSEDTFCIPVSSEKNALVEKSQARFDIKNTASRKLSEKLHQNARQCDTSVNQVVGNFDVNLVELPQSTGHKNQFGEQKFSWRIIDSKVILECLPSIKANYKHVGFTVSTNWNLAFPCHM